MELLERAADLGDVFAQGELAQDFFNRDFVPKCNEKARSYAEKEANQDAFDSQSILARIMMSSHYNSPKKEKEVRRLLVLASFQG